MNLSKNLLFAIIILFVGSITIFGTAVKFNEALQLEKQQVCEPWFPKGTATMLYRDECSQDELIAIKEFGEEYCKENKKMFLPCMGTKDSAKEYYDDTFAKGRVNE